MARLLALFLILLPLPLFAATLQADESLDLSVSPADNAYLAGAEVRVTAPVPEDLLAAGGLVDVAADVAGDALLAGGSIRIASPVGGDVRAAGGEVIITAPVQGDMALLGGTVRVAAPAGEMQVAGGYVELTGGAAGPVTVYGGTVVLSGTFEGNVRVVASDRIQLAEGTVIRGAFEYNAPQEAVIPASATVEGEVRYIGSSSFLPSSEEAQAAALAGVGVLFVVRLVAGAVAAALLVGLFPMFSNRLASTALGAPRDFMRQFLIGFGIIVGTPVAIVLLLASFVGIGIAAILGAAYLLLLLLSYLYAAALAGALIMRFAAKRLSASWKSAVLGMVILYLLGLVPGIGFAVGFVFSAAAAGAFCTLAYQFAFRREAL